MGFIAHTYVKTAIVKRAIFCNGHIRLNVMQLKTKWHFRFRICCAEKRDIVLVFSDIHMSLGCIVIARQGSGWLVPWLSKGIKSLVARNSVE
jgi:hypothetical protein